MINAVPEQRTYQPTFDALEFISSKLSYLLGITVDIQQYALSSYAVNQHTIWNT
jgi:hypothetical protein